MYAVRGGKLKFERRCGRPIGVEEAKEILGLGVRRVEEEETRTRQRRRRRRTGFRSVRRKFFVSKFSKIKNSFRHAGWWKVKQFLEINGNVAIEFGANSYVHSLDNGLFCTGPTRPFGEGPEQQEILTERFASPRTKSR